MSAFQSRLADFCHSLQVLVQLPAISTMRFKGQDIPVVKNCITSCKEMGVKSTHYQVNHFVKRIKHPNKLRPLPFDKINASLQCSVWKCQNKFAFEESRHSQRKFSKPISGFHYVKCDWPSRSQPQGTDALAQSHWSFGKVRSAWAEEWPWKGCVCSFGCLNDFLGHIRHFLVFPFPDWETFAMMTDRKSSKRIAFV